jgi:hypothetical protein
LEFVQRIDFFIDETSQRTFLNHQLSPPPVPQRLKIGAIRPFEVACLGEARGSRTSWYARHARRRTFTRRFGRGRAPVIISEIGGASAIR